jgi:hypothetical protein
MPSRMLGRVGQIRPFPLVKSRTFIFLFLNGSGLMNKKWAEEFTIKQKRYYPTRRHSKGWKCQSCQDLRTSGSGYQLIHEDCLTSC